MVSASNVMFAVNRFYNVVISQDISTYIVALSLIDVTFAVSLFLPINIKLTFNW